MKHNEAIRLAVLCINAQIEHMALEPSVRGLRTKSELIEARAILNDMKEPPIGCGVQIGLTPADGEVKP